MIKDLPPVPAIQQAQSVCATLDALGFREAAIGELLGLADLRAMGRTGKGVFAYRLRAPTPLACLCRLFLLEQTEPRAEVERCLGAQHLESLLNAGLLILECEQVIPLLSLRTVGELRLVSDLHAAHQPAHADFVLGPGPVAAMLAGMALPGPHECVLDLGAGCGVLACQAAADAGTVVATDLSPRAAAFARFNAALNGRNNVEVCSGDLFAPVAGQQFDLILSNPPMVLAPDATYLYRDGGADICARIVRGAPNHLAPGGSLQMLCNWPERAGQDWREVPAEWFRNTGCDGWLLRLHTLSAETYADLWLRQQPGAGAPTAQDIAHWVEHLQALGADAVGGGLLMLRPSPHAEPIRVLRSAPAMGESSGRALQQWMRAHDCLAANEDDDTLLALKLRPAPELQQRVVLEAQAEGWQKRQQRLTLANGLGFSARADATLLGVVSLLDGTRSLREAAILHAERIGVEPKRPLLGLPAAVRQLLRLGMLVPPTGPASRG